MRQQKTGRATTAFGVAFFLGLMLTAAVVGMKTNRPPPGASVPAPMSTLR